MNRLTDPVILIVDPDAISATGTRAVLQYQKYDVHAAENLAGAIQLARALPLDLLICDEQIDGRGGLDCVDVIHQIPDCRDCPVMFISKHQQAGVIRRRHDFGAAYHLKKPLDAVTLLELIDRVLWLPMTQAPVAQPHFRPAAAEADAGRTESPARKTHSRSVPIPHLPAPQVGDPAPPLAAPVTFSPPPVV